MRSGAPNVLEGDEVSGDARVAHERMPVMIQRATGSEEGEPWRKR